MRENFGSVPVCGCEVRGARRRRRRRRFRSYRSYKGSGTAFYIGIRSTVVGETTARGMYVCRVTVFVQYMYFYFLFSLFFFPFFFFFLFLSFFSPFRLYRRKYRPIDTRAIIGGAGRSGE